MRYPQLAAAVLLSAVLVACSEDDAPVGPSPIMPEPEVVAALPPICDCDLAYPPRQQCEDPLSNIIWDAHQWKIEACRVEPVQPDERTINVNLRCDRGFSNGAFSCTRTGSDLSWDMSCDGSHDWPDMQPGSSFGNRGRVRASRFDLQVSSATSSMRGGGCRV